MSKQELSRQNVKNLKDKFSPPGTPARMSRFESRKSKNIYNEGINNLRNTLPAFREVIEEYFKDGRINLGTNIGEMERSNMPDEIAACFIPEFGYQPEDITSFHIKPRIVDRNNVTFELLEIKLERKNMPWITVHAGVDYKGGRDIVILHAYCVAKQAQNNKGRVAMQNLIHPFNPNLNIDTDSMLLLNKLATLQTVKGVLVYAYERAKELGNPIPGIVTKLNITPKEY